MTTFTINDKSAVTSVDPTVDFFPIWKSGSQQKATAAQIIKAAGLSAPLVSLTVNVATSGGDFTDIASAIDYVETHYSNAKTGNGDVDTSFALVQVDDGVWNVPTSLSAGRNTYLQLSGKTVLYQQMSSVVSSSGSSGAWSIVCQLDAVTGMAINDYACFYSPPTGGVNPSYLAGCWKITNVDTVNKRITVLTTHLAAAAPSGAVSTYVAVPKTQLHFTGDGIRAWDACCAKISDIILVGNGTNAGLSIQDESRIYSSRIGITNFSEGLYCLLGSECNGDSWICTCGNTSVGTFVTDSGSVNLGNLLSSGNPIGVQAADGGQVKLGNGVASGNQYGAKVSLFGTINVGGCSVTGNTVQGTMSNTSGYISDVDTVYANNAIDKGYNFAVDGSLSATDVRFTGGLTVLGATAIDTLAGTASYITGAFSTFYTADNKCAVYATSGGGASYPFNAFGHLIIQSRGNSGTDVCIASNSAVIANFTSSGTVGIGVNVPTATLDVGTGTIKGKIISQANSNVPVGTNSLHALTSGTGNCALGTSSGYAITTGTYNCCFGDSALDGLTTGSQNIGMGTAAGESTAASTVNQTTINSIYIGANTKALVDGVANETVIGYTAIGKGDNSVVIGNTAVTNTHFTGDTSFHTVGANGQTLAIKSLTELTTIAAAATTDTAIQMPAGAIILGVSVRVTATVTCTSTFTVGDSGSAARFNTASVSKTAGSVDEGTKAGAYYNAGATSIRITPDTTPSDNTGRVRVTIHYILVTPPTS